VQHRDGLVDDVALFAQAGAVSGAAPSDHGFDPACPQQSAVGVVVAANTTPERARQARLRASLVRRGSVTSPPDL
jgi:hypothetical protein